MDLESHLVCNSSSASVSYQQKGRITFSSEGHSMVEVHASVPVTQVFSAGKLSVPSAFIKSVKNVADDVQC